MREVIDGAGPESACYRHTDRPAGVRCQRCERVICPDCQHIAAVGFHCPECLAAARRARLATTSRGGAAAVPGRRSRRPAVVSGQAAFNLARRPAVLTGLLVAANLVMFVVAATWE